MSGDSVDVRTSDGEWHEVRGAVTLNYRSDLSEADERRQAVFDVMDMEAELEAQEDQ